MGSTVCQAVLLDDELQLVAAVDPRAAGEAIVGGPNIASEHRAFADAGCEVVVDFSTPDAARITIPWLALHGIHGVVGTTGFSEADIAAFGEAFGDGSAHCLIAANFSVSAVLMMHFAELAAPWFDTAEIVELHHDAKVDAPSGTAMTTAARMAAASDHWGADPTRSEVVSGARGGEGPGGIRVHAVRMRGMVAHQEVILGALGQTLTIRQDSYDRASYMPGVVLACKHIAEHPGVTIGLDRILGLT